MRGSLLADVRSCLLAGAMLAACGRPAPAVAGLNASERAAAQALLLPLDLPAAPRDILMDGRATAELGYALFYDARLSRSGQTRCASCHDPSLAFGDGLPRSRGLAQLGRNAPSLLNAGWSPSQFWDGRLADLSRQALQPLEHPDEMGMTRLAWVHQVASLYAAPMAAIFGPLPPLNDLGRFPPAGGPGDPSYEGMAAPDRAALEALAGQIAAFLGGYVRALTAGRGRLDDFLLGQASALSGDEQAGLGVFLRAGCSDCHGGSSLSDGAYHNLGLPGWPGAAADPGRAAIAPAEADALGAFRSPSLRNVGATSPYGHNGSLPTLEAVVDLHLAGGGTPEIGQLDRRLRPQHLSAAERQVLLDFLRALNGRYRGEPSRPPDWWSWPDR